MTIRDAPLAEAAETLRNGSRDPADYAANLYQNIDELEPDVHAWVDGPKPRDWVEAEADALTERYPDPDNRPPLYGVPVGVKDIFHVDGLPTKAGSDLPPGHLAGPQAPVVTALREAGALVLGKTVTTEFAYFEPGPTRNPHALAHTPGGSSSGSAAAVAAGMCPLALGTQTIGSVIRPATFCGVVGYKPTHGRISLDGVIPVSPAVDHVGLFTQDAAGMGLAASVCLEDWDDGDEPDGDRPVLGVPDDGYLEQATPEGRDGFEAAVDTLQAAGFEVRRVEAFDDIEAVNERHERLVAAEMARSHHDWFAEYGDRYAESTVELVREGEGVSIEAYEDARRGRDQLRRSLEATMADHGTDVWVTPGAPGPAPEGIDDTGDPVMNGPWTHAGMPALAIPAGTVEGLPFGLQCVGAFGADETLLAHAEPLEEAVSERS